MATSVLRGRPSSTSRSDASTSQSTEFWLSTWNGYSSVATKVEARKNGDLGDLEQNGTDLLSGVDYTHLTAMMAPRPTLLIYDAEDDCCFRAPLVKPLIYDGVAPFFKYYGKENVFQWYENRDPGTHNYQLNNREQAYRFFSQQFGLPAIEKEIPAGQEIKSYDELVVGLPKDNLTILDLARKLASGITRSPVPPGSAAKTAWANSERQKLISVVCYKPVRLARAWTIANTKHKGVETLSYLFEMSNGLRDRKSTRLNSSHLVISYAVFCLKKKKKK